MNHTHKELRTGFDPQSVPCGGARAALERMGLRPYNPDKKFGSSRCGAREAGVRGCPSGQRGAVEGRVA